MNWCLHSPLEDNSGDSTRKITCQMQAAFQNLDDGLTREYRIAIETVPDLVESETPFIDFLRTENYDANKAARRLAMYWKYRKDIFGDRWLLRMTQTGTGTLAMGDIEILRSGYLLVFPTPTGPVLLLDSTRLKHALANVLDRCVFYILTTCSDETAQTQGGTLLSIVSSRKGPVKDMNQRQQQWSFVHSAMPFKFKRAVVVQSYEEEGKQRLLEFLAYKQSRLLEYTSGIHTDLISKDSFSTTLRELLKEGFDRAHIPVDMGGDFDYGMVARWTRMRISLEDAVSAAPPKRNVIPNQIIVSSMIGNASHLQQGSNNALIPATKTNKVKQQFHKELTRKRNASYARRSYHRKKMELVFVQEKLSAVERENAQLRAQGKRLESLLLEATRITAQLQPSDVSCLSELTSGQPNVGHSTCTGASIPNEGFVSGSSGSSVATGSSGSQTNGQSSSMSTRTATSYTPQPSPYEQGLLHHSELSQPDPEWHEQSQLRHFWNEALLPKS